MASEADVKRFSAQCAQIMQQIRRDIVGQEDVVENTVIAMIAGGNVLLEGVPGIGKTRLVRSLARVFSLPFSRIQFTPDLMPSDVLGTSVFSMKTSEFDFHPGPVFANIVLADEINRSPAKTQAALFEVMEERQATIDGNTYKMDDVYTIIATQNPIEQEGTYRLPEAQLDRFLMKITMGFPSVDEEVEILKRHNGNSQFARINDVEPIMTKEQLTDMRRMMDSVVMEESLMRYIAEIISQTRKSKAVFVGASPRATVAVMQCAKAYALLQGRDFVTPDDIKAVAPYVIHHRIILNAEAEMSGLTPDKVTRTLIDKVEVPK